MTGSPHFVRNPDPVKAMPHFLGKLIGPCGSCGSREIVPSCTEHSHAAMVHGVKILKKAGES